MRDHLLTNSIIRAAIATANTSGEGRLAVQYSPRSQFAATALGYMRWRAPAATSDARRILNEWISTSHSQDLFRVYLAMIFVVLGENGTALNWPERAYDQGAPALSGVIIDTQFQKLRTHPHLRKLPQKMGLAAA
jgi:hypothetical protein